MTKSVKFWSESLRFLRVIMKLVYVSLCGHWRQACTVSIQRLAGALRFHTGSEQLLSKPSGSSQSMAHFEPSHVRPSAHALHSN